MKTLLAFGLFVLFAFGAAAQGDDTFTDGRFELAVPSGWTDESTDEIAHFVSPDGEVDLYAASVEGTDTAAVLDEIAPDLPDTPLQSNDIPLTNVTWHQDVYLIDGELVALLTTTQDDATYILLARGGQQAVATATPAINNALFGFTILSSATQIEEPAYFTGLPYEEQDITITSEFDIPCTLTLPLVDAPAPAVLILTGSGSSDRDGTLGANKPYRDLAWGLATNGVASLRCDDRGFAVPVAELDMTTFTIDDEYTEDALAALDALREIEAVDADRLYLLGHSLGGTLAPRVAQQDGDIAGVILLAGGARPLDVAMAEQIAYVLSLEGENADPAAYASIQALIDQFTALRAGDAESVPESQRAYLQSLIDYDPLETAAELDVPFLVLQGERDYQATLEDAALWEAALEDNPEVTVITYPDLNHFFQEGEGMQTPTEILERDYVSEQVITTIVEWISAM